MMYLMEKSLPRHDKDTKILVYITIALKIKKVIIEISIEI